MEEVGDDDVEALGRGADEAPGVGGVDSGVRRVDQTAASDGKGGQRINDFGQQLDGVQLEARMIASGERGDAGPQSEV